MADHRLFVTAFVLAALLGLVASDAHAQDESLAAYGPSAVGLPPNWTTPPDQTPQRLARAQPAYAGQVTVPTQVRTARVTPRGSYDITSGPFRPRGPVEVRDYWIPAQPRMTLPAISPDAPRHGSWTITFHIDRGNDFGWEQTPAGDNPVDRRFIVDGEHQST